MQQEISDETETTRAIKTVKCLPELECKICGNWTIMKGTTDIAMIMPAQLVHISVVIPEPAWTNTL